MRAGGRNPPTKTPVFISLFTGATKLSVTSGYATTPPVSVSINYKNKKHDAVIDSGAGVSIIDEELVLHDRRLKNHTINITNIEGNSVNDKGLSIIEFTLNGHIIKHPMLVLQNPPFKILFGLDFLNAAKADIKLSTKSLFSPRLGTIPLKIRSVNIWDHVRKEQHSGNYSNATEEIPRAQHLQVRTKSPVVIPGRSAVYTPIYVAGLTDNTAAIAEPLKRAYVKHRLLIPRMILTNQTKYCVVTNPAYDPKTLPAHMILATGYNVIVEKPDETKMKVQNKNTATEKTNEMKLEKLRINPKLSPTHRDELISLVTKYQDVFSWDEKTLGRCTTLPFEINTNNATPIRRRPYRLSEAQRVIVQQHVDEMLEKDIIEPALSPWSSPIVMVRKKGDPPSALGTRFCVDYRHLNSVVPKLSHP